MGRMRDGLRRILGVWLAALLLVASLSGCAGRDPDEGRPSWRRVEPGMLDGPRIPAPADAFRA